MPEHELTGARIAAFLTPAAAKRYTVCVEDSLPSTNTALKALAADGAPEGLVLIAREQTAGRGRLGRTFHSPMGTGLYMSVLFRPAIPPEAALRITTSAAAAAAEAVDAVRGNGLPPTGIKWVNDLYLGGRKIAGILTEAGLDMQTGGLAYAVLGIGVNLTAPAGGFPGVLAETAAAVFDRAEDADGSLLAAEILNRLFPAFDDPCAEDLLTRYRARSVLDGRRVMIRRKASLGGEEEPAVVLGIDENAGLRVRFADGREETLTSGEVVPVSVHLAAE